MFYRLSYFSISYRMVALNDSKGMKNDVADSTDMVKEEVGWKSGGSGWGATPILCVFLF